jgi:hypothetical protein
MQEPMTPPQPAAALARETAGAPSRLHRPRPALRRRHLEAHAVAWLRSLRDAQPVRRGGAEAGRDASRGPGPGLVP